MNITSTYRRVIPRDLFNEADLLKCCGQLFIILDRLNIPGVKLIQSVPNERFLIEQDETDGSIYVVGLMIMLGDCGYEFKRPLNSRDKFPLLLCLLDGDIEVFSSEGGLTPQMLAFINQ